MQHSPWKEKRKKENRDLIQILKILLYKRYCQKNKKKITDWEEISVMTYQTNGYYLKYKKNS